MTNRHKWAYGSLTAVTGVRIPYGTPFSNKSNNFSRRIREFVQGSFSQNPFWTAHADLFLTYYDVVDEQLDVGPAHGRRRGVQRAADCAG